MTATDAGGLCFDAFTLDRSRCILRRGEEELPLRPKAFDVLVYLACHPNRVVSKEELFDAVWPGIAVTDDSLVQCIRDVRQALGDAGIRLIKTVPRRGYEFTVAADTVRPADPAKLASPSSGLTQGGAIRASYAQLLASALLLVVVIMASWLVWRIAQRLAPLPATMMAVPTLGIAPIASLSSDTAGVRAAWAITDDIATEFARAPGSPMVSLKPIAPHFGEFTAKSVASRQSGVRYLLLGTLRAEGEAWHLNLQLIEADSGRQVWAHPYRYAADAQARTAASIARTLSVEIILAESLRPLPAEPQAAHYSILARALISKERDREVGRQARELYKKALAADRTWVPALVGYAMTTLDEAVQWGRHEQSMALLADAERSLDQAIAREPRHIIAHRLRGSALRAKGDLDNAVAAFQHVLFLNPNFAAAHAEIGLVKIEMGLAHEAVPHIEHALSISPADPSLTTWCRWAGLAEVHASNYQAAVEWFLKARQANRRNTEMLPWIAVSLSGLGRTEEARATMKAFLAARPAFTISAWERAYPSRNPALQAQRSRIADMLRQLGVPDGPKEVDAR
jgi:DNA-binding winged helix-turn-helix (wHTH) protein/TolB-like protein/Tfp pilus assembly protein PilF